MSIQLASIWLGLAFLMSFYAWLAGRRLAALLLPLSVIIAAGALWVPTGTPRFTPVPAGKYTVLGAKIVVDVGIWVLLDDGASEPRYYRLKYSTSAANELQGAQDAGQGQPGSVKMNVGQDGGAEFDGPAPVAGDPPKVPEQPAVSIP
jgi:hypothetical protein